MRVDRVLSVMRADEGVCTLKINGEGFLEGHSSGNHMKSEMMGGNCRASIKKAFNDGGVDGGVWLSANWCNF